MNFEDAASNPFIAPFDSVSEYRYPGKINLNTIPNQQVYDVLMGGYATAAPYADFNRLRWRGGVRSFFRPFRNSNEGNLAAAGVFTAGQDGGAEAGLFRRDAAEPLFEKETGEPAVNVTNNAQNAYFENAMRQRLGNLATTRSSVFAIWITVGYFEVDQDDNLLANPSGPGGVEIGRDDGGAVRNRGFYLFDRSIPVAYEPGKNHNIERAILVQSIIE